MHHRRVILWFRNDLRIHDNEAIIDGLKYTDEIIPVYIFDDRVFRSKTKFGFPKTGQHRARFIIESVQDLRDNLKKLNSNLIVRSGITEDIIFDIAQEYKANIVLCNRERTQEEVDVQDNLEKKLWTIGREVRYYRGKMLYYTADLPFPVTHTPDNFASFRKEVEKFVPIRMPFDPLTESFKDATLEIEEGPIPTLKDLGLTDDLPSDMGFIAKGGESEALRQLDYYIWESGLIKRYKETRNGLLGRDFSSKFSAWLAVGCLSPKKIYEEVKKYESEHGANDSTYGLIFELLWRDFFRLIGKKYENKIFQITGITADKSIVNDLSKDFDVFWKWTKGETGIPFIDANMKELNATGFMSNRGRQNVASFLVKDLKINWLMGAEYFESQLIDYDPCSNYGNWNYIAGVGTDPRSDRYFNILSQAQKYDPKGEFVRYWIPELSDLSNAFIHQPHKAPQDALEKLNAIYLNPIIDSKIWE